MTKLSSASFETALTELEGLIQTMEKGGLPLEDALNAYQQGMELIKFCQSKLDHAEQQLKVLDDDGLHTLEPPNGQ